MSSLNPMPSVTTNTVSRPAPNEMGNGLFASTAIKTGEDVLHVQTPFVVVLDSPRLQDTCSGCFGKRQLDSGTELKACTGCRAVKYCDRTCQSKDWKFAHSLECPIFQKLKPMVLPNNARALLRVVLRTGRSKYTSEELEIFANLESHLHEIQQQQAHLDRIYLTGRAVKNYSETDMKEETITAYAAKLDLNSFNLTTALYDRIGLYLHPYAALINHSCDYNCTMGFDGDELFVKAVRPIKKDEQVFISYIDTTTPYEVRRQELKERYFFDCQCSKCAKGTETPEDRFSETPKHKSVLETAERQALEAMQTVSASDTEPADAIKALESAIHTLRATKAWPLTRQPYASLRDQLIVSLLSAGNFNRAFLHAAIRYLRIDTELYTPAHPLRHIHAWTLAKLAIYLSQGSESSSREHEPITFQDVGLNLHYIIWYILADLASRQPDSCTVPSFKKLVGANFAQVHQEFKANGVDPSMSKAVVSAEWAKFENLVQKALELE